MKKIFLRKLCFACIIPTFHFNLMEQTTPHKKTGNYLFFLFWSNRSLKFPVTTKINWEAEQMKWESFYLIDFALNEAWNRLSRWQNWQLSNYKNSYYYHSCHYIILLQLSKLSQEGINFLFEKQKHDCSISDKCWEFPQKYQYLHFLTLLL